MQQNRTILSFLIFPIILLAAFHAPVGLAESDEFSITIKKEKPKKPETPAEQIEAAGYTKRGADTCLRCHDEESEYPVLPIFKTKHAVVADERTPFAGRQCEACHGPGEFHTQTEEGEEAGSIVSFNPVDDDLIATPERYNRLCLNCHEKDARIGWQGSVHESVGTTCTNCHRIHVEHDQVLATASQPDVCLSCHKQQRAEIHRASAHPIRFGQMACSECHNPHGSVSDTLLIRPTINETCYTCHAEKRGPFLWEHAPVAEDCTTCHVPHGSSHPALLARRLPLLCQQCHSQTGHPSVAYTAGALPPSGAAGFLVAKSCLNCHSQVHGSNHPSGIKLSR